MPKHWTGHSIRMGMAVPISRVWNATIPSQHVPERCQADDRRPLGLHEAGPSATSLCPSDCGVLLDGLSNGGAGSIRQEHERRVLVRATCGVPLAALVASGQGVPIRIAGDELWSER